MPFDENKWLDRVEHCTDQKNASGILKEWLEAPQEYYDALDHRNQAAFERGLIGNPDATWDFLQMLNQLQNQYKKEGDKVLGGTLHGRPKVIFVLGLLAEFVGSLSELEEEGLLPHVQGQKSCKNEAKKDGKKEGKKENKDNGGQDGFGGGLFGGSMDRIGVPYGGGPFGGHGEYGRGWPT